MRNNTKEVFSFRTLVEKIRNALIHKRKRNGKFQPYNWFHVLTMRTDWLNPFYSSTYVTRWKSFKSCIFSYYLDWTWLRYHTDTAFRLDEKIDKLINKYIAETEWADSYELDGDYEYGNHYDFTCVYYKTEEKPSEDVLYKWTDELANKIYSISDTETSLGFRIFSVYLGDFLDKRFGERWEKYPHIYFFHYGTKDRKEEYEYESEGYDD